jgi:hypothetical protein
VPQGASFYDRDVKFIEGKFLAAQGEMNAMLAQLSRAAAIGTIASPHSSKAPETRWGLLEPFGKYVVESKQ